MKNITIYPKNEKQINLLKLLFEEMKVKFQFTKDSSKEFLSETSFKAKIDASIEQSKKGLKKKKEKEFEKLSKDPQYQAILKKYNIEPIPWDTDFTLSDLPAFRKK